MKITLLIVFVAFFASCQPGSDVKQILAKQETRQQIMDTIATDTAMSNEMMTAMMNSTNGRMTMLGNDQMNRLMMGNHEAMIHMMKNNPDMMKSMMKDVMESCKGDTSLMSGMCKTMMDDPKMTEMMSKMKGMRKN